MRAAWQVIRERWGVLAAADIRLVWVILSALSLVVVFGVAQVSTPFNPLLAASAICIIGLTLGAMLVPLQGADDRYLLLIALQAASFTPFYMVPATDRIAFPFAFFTSFLLMTMPTLLRRFAVEKMRGDEEEA